MVDRDALIMWQDKMADHVLGIAGGLKFGLSIKPNSQIYHDAYDKAMYALSIVAGEVDIMFPNPIEYKFKED
jgi:hypothetical protein